MHPKRQNPGIPTSLTVGPRWSEPEDRLHSRRQIHRKGLQSPACILAIASAFSLALSSCASDDDATTSVLGVLPVGRIQADIMTGPQRQPSALQIRVREAIAAHSNWFYEHVKDLGPGETPSYHPNFGVSEEEFETWKAEVADVRLEKVATAEFAVKRSGRGTFTLDAKDPIAELDGIKIDLRAGRVRTPFGDAMIQTRVEPSERQRLTGQWRGYKWTNEAVARERGRASGGQVDLLSIEFGIGRLEDTGRGVLYYDVTRAEKETVTGRTSRILFFD